MRIFLTLAQQSAIECRDLTGDEQIIAGCWKGRGNTLEFTGAQRDELFTALNEASNSEDAGADQAQNRDIRRQTRSAALCLSRVSTAVLFEEDV